MENRKSLNKISTIGVLFVIGSIASLTNVLGGAFADETSGYGYSCTGVYGYGYGCVKKSKSSGSLSTGSHVFDLKEDTRVNTDGSSSTTNNSNTSTSDNTVENPNKTSNPDSDDVSSILNMSKEKIKKFLDINDDELNNLLDLAKNDKSENKQETKNLIKYYLDRKATKSNDVSENIEDNGLDNGNLDNSDNDGNADINVYPDMLPQTGAQA